VKELGRIPGELIKGSIFHGYQRGYNKKYLFNNDECEFSTFRDTERYIGRERASIYLCIEKMVRLFFTWLCHSAADLLRGIMSK
jgi:hypothetical protein